MNIIEIAQAHGSTRADNWDSLFQIWPPTSDQIHYYAEFLFLAVAIGMIAYAIIKKVRGLKKK